MRIHRKLLMVFSIFMILSLIPAAFSYRELNTLRKRLKPTEIAGDITNSYFEIRNTDYEAGIRKRSPFCTDHRRFFPFS